MIMLLDASTIVFYKGMASANEINRSYPGQIENSNHAKTVWLTFNRVTAPRKIQINHKNNAVSTEHNFLLVSV